MAEDIIAVQDKNGPAQQAMAVKGLKQCDLWNAMRKFANPDIALIAEILHQDGPLNFGELRAKTDLTTSVLNHDLIEMKNVEIVAKLDKKYHITNYGALLVKAIERIKNDIFKSPEENIFLPVQEEDRRKIYA
jgi:DNA-binding HxlR family transcriptional regulator